MPALFFVGRIRTVVLINAGNYGIQRVDLLTVAYRSLQCYFSGRVQFKAPLIYTDVRTITAARHDRLFSFPASTVFPLNSSAPVQLPLLFYIVTFCLCTSLVAPTTQGDDDNAPGVVWRLRCPFYRSSRRVQCTPKRRLYFLNWCSHCSPAL